MLLTACVLPARSFDAYEGKAATAARSAVSQARTASLTAITLERDRLGVPTAAVLLEDAESGAASARDSFASIQPPDAASDLLRSDLLPLLTRSAATIGDMRIAVRRGDVAQVVELSRELDRTSDDLERFADQHG
jgi:hypothetical protein